MVNIAYDHLFERRIKKIKDGLLKGRVKKQITKIINTPEIGKPIKLSRKGTGEFYIKPFRLSYLYLDDKIVFLDLYHKDEQ